MKSKSQLTKADFVRNFPCKKAPRLFWYWKWRGTVKYNPVSVVTVVLFMQSQCWVFRNTSSLSSSFPLWSTSLTNHEWLEWLVLLGSTAFLASALQTHCVCCDWWITSFESWYTEDEEDLQFVVVHFGLIKFFDITNGWNLLIAVATTLLAMIVWLVWSRASLPSTAEGYMR